MTDTGKKRTAEIFNALGSDALLSDGAGLTVSSPLDGAELAQLALDNEAGVNDKVRRVASAQKTWQQVARSDRAVLLESFSAQLKTHRDLLAELITLEAGKTNREALGEADGSADILLKTIKDATLPELGAMVRRKERPPVGVVGLITSFNFPLVVAHWTLAPALLAGNGVLWKPSEKTPLVALACKAIWDKMAGAHADLLHLIIGARETGEALVKHEAIDMISATGSVAMGQGIKAIVSSKKNNAVKPILELGGNNGVIISDKISREHLEWALQSLMNSYLGTAGQRCTNTRRLFVQQKNYEQAGALLQKHVSDFIAAGKSKWDDYGYGPLIDEDAYRRFEQAKKKVAAEGGKVVFGKRLMEAEFPQAYYVEPALALMPGQTAIMHEETFAPLLFVAPYEGDIHAAITLLNAPANAGLVGAIYTQSQNEADQFAAENEAGHGLINSPKGTGTPAFGMGFGGNKASGEGEILNAADPLRAFTRDTKYSRIAQNKDVTMED